MPTCKTLCRIGREHLSSWALCQERAVAVGWKTGWAVALCGGEGGPDGRLAANVTARAVATLLASRFSRYLEEEPDVIRLDVFLNAQRAREALMDRVKTSQDRLQATILAAAMDDKGSYLTLDLGEGEIWTPAGEGWEPVSGPQRAILAGQGWQDPREDFWALRVCRQVRGEPKPLLLLTKGGGALFRSRDRPTFGELEALFDREEPQAAEDYGFAYLAPDPVAGEEGSGR